MIVPQGNVVNGGDWHLQDVLAEPADDLPLENRGGVGGPPAAHVAGVAGPAALRMPAGRAAAFRAVFPILMFHGKHAM